MSAHFDGLDRNRIGYPSSSGSSPFTRTTFTELSTSEARRYPTAPGVEPTYFLISAALCKVMGGVMASPLKV